MNDDIAPLREIRIHNLLGIQDTGRRISVRCPFHGDRTPSLAIYPDNSWYCFGCALSGQNAIDFTIACGYTFKEAVEELKKLL